MSLFEGAKGRRRKKKGKGKRRKVKRRRGRRRAKKKKRKIKRNRRKVQKDRRRKQKKLRELKRNKTMSRKQKRRMKRRLKRRIERLKQKQAELREKQRIYGNRQSQLDLKLKLEYPEGQKNRRNPIGHSNPSEYFTRQSTFSQLAHPLCSILDNNPHATTNNKILISEKSDISGDYFHVFGEDKILTCENNKMKLKAAQEIAKTPPGITVPSHVIVPTGKTCGSHDRSDLSGNIINYCGGTIEFDSIFGSSVIAKDETQTVVLSGGRIYPDIYDFTNNGSTIRNVLSVFDNSGSLPPLDANSNN